MSTIAAYARARAVAASVAQPVATVRHVHLAERPLVFVPLNLAGEVNAPLAAMVGTDPARPELLVVPQPRNRDLRSAFAARLAGILSGYVESMLHDVEPHRDGVRFTDAPQLLVPNRAGAGFVRLFGRATRFQRTDGPYAVPPAVPLLGRWLTWFAERAEHPGSCVLLATTEALGLHWATGQSALEDANLAALLGWIAPPPGLTGAAAAKLAENAEVWPPAGPATDPVFDTRVLAPAVAAWNAAPDGSPARAHAHGAVERALRGQLEPTWRLMWQAVDLLRGLPAGETVTERWARDRGEFTTFVMALRDGAPPQARRDGAVAAARRLGWLEQERAAYDAARAFDDPLVMAAHRVAGEAFVGTVVAVDRERRVTSGKGRLVTRPLVEVRTTDPVHLAPGVSVVATTRRKQAASVVSVFPDPDGALVTLELSGGMGRAVVPPPGTVPEVGDTLCYSSVLAENVPSPALPSVDDTPWTHGGPPPPFVPDIPDEDAEATA